MGENKLIQAIEKHNPTVLSLSFCYTDVSELNDILRSAGTYAILILSKDQANITEGRYLVLDPVQKKIIQKVDEIKPKNIFLWGSSGTGKTFLLSQILGMKISHYKKMQGIKLNVIVTSYFSGSEESLLLKEFKAKYLEHLSLSSSDIIVSFTPFEILCKEMGLKVDRMHPIGLVNWLMYHISQKYTDFHNIVLLDEVFSVKEG